MKSGVQRARHRQKSASLNISCLNAMKSGVQRLFCEVIIIASPLWFECNEKRSATCLQAPHIASASHSFECNEKRSATNQWDTILCEKIEFECNEKRSATIWHIGFHKILGMCLNAMKSGVQPVIYRGFKKWNAGFECNEKRSATTFLLSVFQKK